MDDVHPRIQSGQRALIPLLPCAWRAIPDRCPRSTHSCTGTEVSPQRSGHPTYIEVGCTAWACHHLWIWRSDRAYRPLPRPSGPADRSAERVCHLAAQPRLSCRLLVPSGTSPAHGAGQASASYPLTRQTSTRASTSQHSLAQPGLASTSTLNPPYQPHPNPGSPLLPGL